MATRGYIVYTVQPLVQPGTRGRGSAAPLRKRAYEISNLPKDFKISAKISISADSAAKISDFSEDFKILCNRTTRRCFIIDKLQRFHSIYSKANYSSILHMPWRTTTQPPFEPSASTFTIWKRPLHLPTT